MFFLSRVVSVLLAVIIKRSSSVYSAMAYLLVCWDSDNSVSVVGKKAKGMLEHTGDRVRFRWPGVGICDGSVLNSSGRSL